MCCYALYCTFVDVDVSITSSSGSTAVDILEGHNSQKAAEIRKLLHGLLPMIDVFSEDLSNLSLEHGMQQSLERHKRQSQLLAMQSASLMDFGIDRLRSVAYWFWVVLLILVFRRSASRKWCSPSYATSGGGKCSQTGCYLAILQILGTSVFCSVVIN